MAREVKIYTTPTCPYCKMAKKFLDDNGIKYQEFDIAKDKAAREEMKSKCNSLAVPTICSDGEGGSQTLCSPSTSLFFRWCRRRYKGLMEPVSDQYYHGVIF